MTNLTPVLISGVSCYEQDGTAYLRLEDVARGLGFTTVAASGNEVIRWSTVHKYLTELGVATSCNGSDYRSKCPDYIPENIFYRLAMKAKNETAEKFQALVADEIIPSIRKTGGYIAQQESMTPEELLSRALDVAHKILADRDARLAAQDTRISELTVQTQTMQPKADYFDELVDRNLLTSFRDTAKQLEVGEKVFIGFLLEHKYIYRDKKGHLMPYAEKNDGLFEVKESANSKTKWAGTQTLITPKGRETFRLMLPKMLPAAPSKPKKRKHGK